MVADYIPLVQHIAERFIAKMPAHGNIDDMKQEGFLALSRAGAGFDPARGVKFLTYAYRSIRNAMVTYCQCLPPPCDDVPPREVPGREREGRATAALRDAIDELRDRERTIIQLRYWEGLNNLEIGERLGVSGERVRQIGDKAIERLRRKMIAA